MNTSILKIYRDYKLRLQEIDSMEQKLLHTRSKKEWIGYLVKKSEMLRIYYSTTEKELNQYIRPYLSGSVALDDESAGALFEGAWGLYI